MAKGDYRKIKDTMKADIRKAFANLTGSGVPEPALARMLADLAIGYLELPEETVREWYEEVKHG
jgi:phosphoribosylaminoimidazole (AIR) synthetase